MAISEMLKRESEEDRLFITMTFLNSFKDIMKGLL